MKSEVLAAVRARLAALDRTYPGVTVEDRGAELHVVIPDRFRVGHEAHFAEVATKFLSYLRDRPALPAWERSNMLAKYYVTTRGTELSRQSPPKTAPRIAPKSSTCYVQRCYVLCAHILTCYVQRFYVPCAHGLRATC
jgi:hypothetical protein